MVEKMNLPLLIIITVLKIAVVMGVLLTAVGYTVLRVPEIISTPMTERPRASS